MTPLPPPDQDDIFDPALEAMAGAILDGDDVDWEGSSASASVAVFTRELRLVAGVAALHRSLSDDEAEPLRFPPEYPWHVGTLSLTASLGRGTYGEVFRAWDNELHRDVAVKLLFGGLQRGDTAARALDEGRLLARVRHPNVVAVFGVERIDGRVGLVTEYVEGRTLSQIVRDSGPLGPEQAARIGIDLGHALAAVHGSGLLHRDVKAQNVIREEGGRIVLMDFGAGLATDAAPALAGTPLYLAPEVLGGDPATRQSDIYSAGVLLHYLLTGGYPVAGSSLEEIREAQRHGVRARLVTARPDLPRALASAIDRATEPDPVLRYATAGDFSRALGQAVLPRRMNARAAVMVAAAVLAIAAGTLLWLMLKPRPVPLASAPSGIASRVTLPPQFHFGGASLDGRYLSYVDTKQAAWVVQTGTGHARRITAEHTKDGSAEVIILSGDGTRAAYAWRMADNSSQLRVADIEDRWPQAAIGAPPAATIVQTEPNASITPLEWSRDATSLLFTIYRNDGRIELMTSSRDGSRQRVIQTFTAGPPRRATFSTDGRFIVYDQAAAMPSPQRDLFIVPADGSRAPAILSGGASNDEMPLWSADGDAVIFVSDRDGSGGVWRMPVRDGVAAGSPRLLARGAEALTPVSLSANGDYYYSLQTKFERLHTVPLDERGVASGPAQIVPDASAASRISPAWSPDGSTLAFVTLRGMNLFDHASVIALRGTDGRAIRNIAPQLTYFSGGQVRWAPNGRELLVRGRALDGYWGFHRIDAATGAAVTIVRGQPRGREENVGLSPAWGPEGNSLIYVRPGFGIVERHLASDRQDVIVPAAPGERLFGLGLSRSGGRLAFSKTVQVPKAQAISILAVREPDGTITELLRRPGDGAILFVEWMPGGEGLLYAAANADRSSRLWIMPAAGGAPVDTGVTVESSRTRVSLRPDGRALTYSSGSTAFEVWVMRGIAR